MVEPSAESYGDSCSAIEDMPADLKGFSFFVSDVVSYIAGFICRKLANSLKFSACVSEMASNPTFSELIEQKYRGGLIYPGLETEKLCKEGERKLSFFRITYVIVHVLKNRIPFMAFIYVLRFELDVVLVISLVLAGDRVQAGFLTGASRVCDLFLNVNGQRLKISYDDKSMVLTGWDMFILRKPLLLSLAAWLFTYVVIIIQYFDNP
ncbi:hypothetical protein AVEN_260561-1 [Araneus ventricosus]|uniref:Uncharacterized protein n=1 Tax=Araneus ventricosus TaxID=182803 RepID=A0A4Y2TW67_ARAVE|nr:hypothetical protein AVEN_260561-1 [Araneus ventricosus]